MTVDPAVIPLKTSDPGTAATIADIRRRVETLEAQGTRIGNGCVITNVTYQTNPTTGPQYPGIKVDSNGLQALNASGATTLFINALDGSLTVTGTGSITGGTIRTSPNNPKLELTSIGLRGYDASGTAQFILDSTTGLIQCTGIITAQPGSSIPIYTTTGALPGGANRYSNANFQDGAGTYDFTGWSTNGTASDGGTMEPPIYGSRVLKLVTGASSAYIMRTTIMDPYLRVVVGLNYTFSHYEWQGGTVYDSRIDINWYDAAGVLLSTTTGTTQPTTSTGWKRIVQTATPPANAMYAVAVHYVAIGAPVGTATYCQCFQMEQGDRESAWMPRPDEILYNTINTQMLNAGAVTAAKINVATLSAITANLGTVNAGTINGVDIMIPAGTNDTPPNVSRLQWMSGALVAGEVFSFYTGGGGNLDAIAYADGATNSYVRIYAENRTYGVDAGIYALSGDTNAYGGLNSQVWAWASGGSSPAVCLVDWQGHSSFINLYASLLYSYGTVRADGDVNSNTVTSNGISSYGGVYAAGQFAGPGTAGAQMQQRGYATSSDNGRHSCEFFWQGDGYMRFYTDSTYVGYANLPSSDKIKRDVALLEGSSLERVNGLQPITYRHDHYMFTNDNVHIGFVAEQVQCAVPSAVHSVNDPTAPEDSPNLAVDPTPIAALLVGAVQELGNRIDPTPIFMELLKADTLEHAKPAMLAEITRQLEAHHHAAVIRQSLPGGYEEDLTHLEQRITDLHQQRGPNGRPST